MIIRKPYGFLAKHYKLINLIILIPMLYLTLKFGDIGSFFRGYVASKYNTVEVIIADKYITGLTYLATFAAIISNLFVFVVLRSKKKNGLLYLANSIYYIFLLFMTFLLYSTMNQIETITLDATYINFIRDLATMIPLPSYVLIAIVFTNAIGFNFKTMRFDNKLDLQLSDDDDDEMELKLNNEGYILKRQAVHSIRELKYYFFENRFVITCIGVVILLIICSSIYMNYEVYNKKYNIYQAFALDNAFTMTLKESYITNVNMRGEIINRGSYFLIVKIGITNNSREDKVMDKKNFRLYCGSEAMYPSYDRSFNFMDVATNYQGTPVKGETSDDYIFAYELTEKQLRNYYEMKILSDIRREEGKLIPTYKIIKIRPSDIIKEQNIGEAKVGTEINLKDTTLKNTIFTIESAQLLDKFSYSYDSCVRDNCVGLNNMIVPTQGKVYLVIRDNIIYDQTVSYYRNGRRDILEDFGTIVYEVKRKGELHTYTSKLSNRTPENKQGYKVYEINNLVTQAETVDLQLTIRNKSLVIHLIS